MGAISFSKWMNTQVIKNEIYTAFALIMHLKVGNVVTKLLPLKFHVAITNIKIPGPLSNRYVRQFLRYFLFFTLIKVLFCWSHYKKFISFKFFLLNIELPILDSLVIFFHCSWCERGKKFFICIYIFQMMSTTIL